MSSAAATSLISTPDRPLSFTAVALNRSPYLATLRAPALATTHLQAVSPRCQLIRGKLGVRDHRHVSCHLRYVSTSMNALTLLRNLMVSASKPIAGVDFVSSMVMRNTTSSTADRFRSV